MKLEFLGAGRQWVLQHESFLKRVEGRSWKSGGMVVLWLGPALDGEMDGCRCRDCGWVK